MAYADSLATIQTQITARLIEITANRKPSYSVDGESYSWAEYHSMLVTQLETVEKAIQRAQGPYAVTHRGSV